jgi:Kef-type K+ transport system membrane component KefB
MNVCGLILSRLGCPVEERTIFALDAKAGSALSSNFTCSCGNFNAADTHVHRIIMDKLNDYNLRALPIFSNPVYLSVPMSICITLICGKLGAIAADYFLLPPIIGFLLAGVGIQNFLNPMFLKGAGFPFPSPASELKLIALIIVLMRAGLSIKFEELQQFAVPTACLALIPYLAEFFIFMYVGVGVFNWEVIDMGLFASIMAPLGPSVVISALLMIVADKSKKHGYVPNQVLISTPIEAVIAIVMFGIFTNLEQSTTNPLFPWVKVYPLYANCLLIPVNIIFSIILGILVGAVASRYINYRIKMKTDFVWVRISKNPQMGE